MRTVVLVLLGVTASWVVGQVLLVLWEIRRQLDKLVTMVGRLPSAEGLRDDLAGIRYLLGNLDDDVQKGPRPPAELPSFKAVMDEYNEEQRKRRFAALGILSKAVAESPRPLTQADFDALMKQYEKDQAEQRQARLRKIAAAATPASDPPPLMSVEPTRPH